MVMIVEGMYPSRRVGHASSATDGLPGQRVLIDFQPNETEEEEQHDADPFDQTQDELDNWINEYLINQDFESIVVGYKEELHPLPNTDKSKNNSEEGISDNNNDTSSIGIDTENYDDYTHTHMGHGGPVDHIILVVHGIGPGDEHLNNNLDMMKETFEFVRLHWFWSMKVDCHIEMINWKKHVRDSQKRMFEKITPTRQSGGGEQYRDTRMLLNVATADIIYYITPDKKKIILDTVTKLLNDTVSRLRLSHPQRYSNSRVSLVGHSLGSVILYDILKEATNPLKFEVDRFFLWGSPLAVFLSINNSDEDSEEDSSPLSQAIFDLPHRLPIYNVFHPHDPVAFRLDPLLSADYPKEALVLPHWQKNELRSQTNPKRGIQSSHQDLGRSWMDVMFRPSTENDEEVTLSRDDIVGNSDIDGRVDYALQESATEGIVHSVHRMSIISAHSCYWNSRDLATFMLKVLAGVHPIAPLYIDDDISTP